MDVTVFSQYTATIFKNYYLITPMKYYSKYGTVCSCTKLTTHHSRWLVYHALIYIFPSLHPAGTAVVNVA